MDERMPATTVVLASATDAVVITNLGGICTTCGWPLASGATCIVDGTVAP